MQIADKVVLITGASEGIGAACAAAFGRRGARLSLAARSEDKLKQAAGEAGTKDTLIVAGDVTSGEDRKRIVERTLERLGRIDILINNAGVGLYAPSWEAPFDQLRSMMEVNFFAAVAMTQLVVPQMKRQGGGCIVNVSSIAGQIALPWFTLYSSSKYALGAFTRGLRMELKHDNIHAIEVCPGYVKTRFQDHVLAGAPPEGVRKARRFAITAETCAEAIARGVERNRRVVVTPRSGILLIALSRAFPALMDWQLARMYHKLKSNG